MNDIDEFFGVALAILLGITGLLVLITYLEKSLIEPVKEKARARDSRSFPSKAPSRRTRLRKRSRS